MDATGLLGAGDLEVLRKDFAASPAYRLAQNAVTRSPSMTSRSTGRSSTAPTTRSPLLDDWTVTNQKKSGRCWMFAGLNLLRVGAMNTMNLKDFEFCQNYTLFWDKIERANYFLEAIIETAGRDVDDRTVAFLLAVRGRRRRAVEHVRQPGRASTAWCRRRVMPETAELVGHRADERASCATQLREGARTLRDARGRRALRRRGPRKDEILRVIHRILCIHLGTPPERFDWQWTDKDREFHRDGEMTPQEFAARTSTCRSTTTSASCTTRARPARSGARSPSSTSATSSARRRSPTSTSTSTLMKRLAAGQPSSTASRSGSAATSAR